MALVSARRLGIGPVVVAVGPEGVLVENLSSASCPLVELSP